MDEKTIITLLFQRAEKALDILAQVFGRRLSAMANNILGDPQDAQECVNDTYLAIWNTIPPQNPDPLWAYVCRVGKNICCNRLRSNHAQKRCGEYDLSLEELAGSLGASGPEEILDAQALGHAISRYLATEKAQNRIIFIRRYWFGDSIGSIAEHMGLSANTVSVRLNRSRNKLRDYLIQEELING